METPHIKRLKIDRFRGIRSLTWLPDPNVNLILGGGNVGKTTILDAIALLLHPTSGYPLSDADYLLRDVDSEFEIEAVISLPAFTGVHTQNAMNWPWHWIDNNAQAPVEGDEVENEPVYKIRVRGTSDQEALHEVIQPDGSTLTLSVGLRRAIGLVRLSGDDRNERDLRLIAGAGLDRLLADKTLRGRLSRRFATHNVNDDLSVEAKVKLTALDATFGERALPTDLALGFVGGTVNALVGLTSNLDGVALPLASWGAGTRRLAALAIADTLQDKHPISVIDEIERGLEPYRQRRLVANLKAKETQVFMTTHSATVLSAASGAALWYVDGAGKIGQLPADKVARHQADDPETFLARLAVVAEGITEVGFVSSLFTKYVDNNWEDLGIRITDGTGNDNVLILLEALTTANLCIAGFADNEQTASGRWQVVQNRLQALLFRWPNGCLEEHLIPLFDLVDLPALIADADDQLTSTRLRTLATRLKIEDNSFEAIAAAAGDGLHALIVEAATGKVPAEFDGEDRKTRNAYKGHSKVWFKSYDGGQELAFKMHTYAVWPKVRGILLPFLNGIRVQSEMDPLPDNVA